MKITELTILTGDFKETKTFYKTILGFNLINETEHSVAFQTGKTKLTFVETKNANPVYHFAFNIPNNKFDEAFKLIVKTVGVISSAEDNLRTFDFESWNAKSFYFRDNNLNILECIARYDLPNQISKPYENTDIECISEVGISVGNVTEESRKIIQQYDLSYFPKQKPGEHFVAMGDDSGLLILGTTNRFWFPTNQPGEKHYTKIKFEISGRIYEVEFS